MHSFEVSLGYESVDRTTFSTWSATTLHWKCISVNAFIPQWNFKRMHSILNGIKHLPFYFSFIITFILRTWIRIANNTQCARKSCVINVREYWLIIKDYFIWSQSYISPSLYLILTHPAIKQHTNEVSVARLSIYLVYMSFAIF
jgi:hypothetical protein